MKSEVLWGDIHLSGEIMLYWSISVVVAAGVAGLVIGWRYLRTASYEARFAKAREGFHAQRERLEAKFVQLASANSKPNSPHWDSCDFGDDVAYVRNRNTGELSAFVPLTVAVEELSTANGTGEVVGNLRAGTAVFRFDRDHWETDGKAILNLSPAQAIRFYRKDWEMIDQELSD
jgi:hypothetical protein